MERAKGVAKKYFGSVCIDCSLYGSDGAHVYPTDLYPHFAELPQNIVVMCRRHHKVFDDDIVTVDRKIAYLEAFEDPQIDKWLGELKKCVVEWKATHGGDR